MFKNCKAVSNAFLATIILVVLVVCITIGFVTYELKPTTYISPTTPTSTATPNQITVTSPSPTPTTIMQPTNIIQFYIKDTNGNPLSDTAVSSIVQPSDVNSVFGITNETGYVTFTNMQIGTYTFDIVKTGYSQLKQTVNYVGKPLSLTLTLQITSQERIIIQAVSYDKTSKTIAVYVQSMTNANPVVSQLLIRDNAGNTIASTDIGTISPPITNNVLSQGTLYTVKSTVLSPDLATGVYTATLLTTNGSSFVSPSFTVG